MIGIGTPTITAQGLGETSTVTFDGTATNNALISGFIITGASGWWPEPEGNGIKCINQASPTIINNSISGNEYDGIYCNNSSSTIINNTISGNENGIYCYSSSPTITNNTISGNGWGIYCDYFSSPTITNNTISGNHQRGISCYSSSPTITNNIISGNKQDGIVCNNSSPTITNNTILGSNWHGIICFSSSPTITNNIITENGTQPQWPLWGCGIENYNGTPTINYNCVWGNGQDGNNNYSGCSAGLNDISFNPQFIDEGDFHLQPISPCVDAGTNTAPALPATDKDGNPRITDGNGDGEAHVDIGAYEYQLPTFKGTIAGKVTKADETTAIQGALIEVLCDSVVVSSTTTDTDGNYLITVEAGTYDVRASASGYITQTKTGYTVSAGYTTTVNFALTDVVYAGRVTVFGPPGNFIGTYTTIQAGIDACPEDGTVTVAAGTYNEAIYINKGIALIGIGKPTITAQGLGDTNTVTFFGIATNNALISGFRITGASGKWPYGNGISCINHSSPTITNNTISGNDGDGIYCYYSSPTITNNIITENGTTTSNYYGIYNEDGTPTLTINYNCVWGNGQGGNNNYGNCSGGTGAITADPQFIGEGNFHLQPTSPCIDAGSNEAPGLPATDKDSNPRIINGIVDMRAYEFQGSVVDNQPQLW